jgi:hypothetical protein
LKLERAKVASFAARAESAAGDFQQLNERAKVASFARELKAPQATFSN